MDTDKLSKFLECLKYKYISESFYSVWKREAEHIITILNIPKLEQNKVYLEIVTLAVSIYENETIPFILNVGTSRVSTHRMSDTDIDELLGIPLTKEKDVPDSS